MEKSEIWVFVELEKSGISTVALELLTVARQLAEDIQQVKKVNCSVVAVTLSDVNQLIINELGNAGADSIYTIASPFHNCFRIENNAAKALSILAKKHEPEIILIGATHFGRGVSARAAVLLNTGLTADCTALSIDNVTGNLVQQRPTFGGNLIATIITPNHRPQMASVRPNVIKRTKYNYNPNPKVVALPLDTGVFDNNVQIIAQKIESSICTLNDAPIIVAGGRGLKNKENVQLVYELANLLNGSVGATRAAVEAGWFPHESQIGQTGITVSPKLYIACGISGQIQHIAGISAAEKIIAINDDKDAPIFEYANYALVGDVTETLTSIITVLNKYKSN